MNTWKNAALSPGLQMAAAIQKLLKIIQTVFVARFIANTVINKSNTLLSYQVKEYKSHSTTLFNLLILKFKMSAETSQRTSSLLAQCPKETLNLSKEFSSFIFMAGSGNLHQKSKARSKAQNKALHEHLLPQTCLNWLIESSNHIWQNKSKTLFIH